MYLKLNGFFDADIAKVAATAAMNFAANGSALIIDLRDNHGGDPRMVAHLASYLLGDKKIHLSDIYFRADNETDSFWSDPAVPGARFGADKPVYVLTSGETFSAPKILRTTFRRSSASRSLVKQPAAARTQSSRSASIAT
jgi:C-terminal processing protease CtpA/Prc